MSSESLAQAVARNSNWINTVISNSKLSSQLSELVSITSLDQKIVVQEGVLDAKYANVKSIRGYKGLWNATTNIPTLSNSSGVVGDVYKVSVAGNINIGSGSIYYVVGDLIYLSEDNWIKISPNQISDITGLQLALDSLAGGLIPQGNWNALSNVPDIGTGATTGQFWIVSVAGSTNVGGITDWEVNDWAVRTATGWAKIDNTDKVLSVAGRTGVIVLGITDITGLTAELANTVKLTGNQSIAGQKTFTELVTMTDRLKLSDSTGNTLIGDLVGTSLTTGAFNVGVGRKVLQDTTVGAYNVGLGDWALYQNTEGSDNFAGGSFTLWTNSTGSFNVAIGHEASRINTTGSFNVAIGTEASKTNTTGGNNIGIGKESLWNNRTGSHNIGVGLQAGKYIANGVGNNRIPQKSIFIGQDTRANADGQTNQIVIGDTAIGNGSNTVTLGNNSIATTYLKGDVNITGSITGGGGDFLPLAGGTLTGDLVISKAGTPLLQLVDTTNNVNLLMGADNSNTFLRASGGNMIFQTAGGVNALTLDASQNAFFTKNVNLHSASTPVLSIKDTTANVDLLLYSQDSDAHIGTYSNHPLKIDTNSTLALTIDTSQNATFAGNVTTGASLISTNAIVDNVVVKTANGNLTFKTNGGSTIAQFRNDLSATFAGDVTTNGQLVVNTFLKLGDGGNGYFYSDSDGRTAFTAGNFYIQSSVLNYYNYAKDQYHGNSSGDNHFFRSNALSGTNWAIDTSGNFGIGTTTPTVGLQLGNSTSGQTQTAIFNSEGGGEVGLTIQSRTNRAKLRVADNDSSAYVVAEAGKAFFGTSANGDANNITVLTSGNVGIGTDSPSAKLHVDNSGFATTSVRFDAGAAADAIVAYGNGGKKYFQLGEVGATDPATMSLFNNEVQTIRLKTNGNSFFNGGNVGIGTDSPSAKLEITGSTPTAGDTTLHLRLPVGNVTAGTTEMGNILFSSTDASGGGSGSIAKISTIAGIGSNAWAGQGRPTDLAFFTQPLGTTSTLVEAMRIDQDGNVGIGNTNPSDYSADANNLVVGSLSGNNGITILSTASSGYGSIYFADSTTGNKVYSGFIRYQQNQSNMTFGTNEVERMRIDVNGDFDFKSGSATFGDNVIVNKTDADGNAIEVQRNGSTISRIYSATNGGVFDLYNGSSNNSIRLDGRTGAATFEGDVSVNRSGSDSSRINLLATGTGNAIIILDAMNGDAVGNNYGSIAQLNTGELEYNIRPSSPNPIHKFIGNATFGGDVGIGTDSPDYKLEVQGEAGIELYNGTGGGNVLNFRPSLGDANKYNMSISSYDHSGSGVGPADGLSINGFDGVSFATGSSTSREERMRIDSSGNVTIGDISTTNTGKLRYISGVGSYKGAMELFHSTTNLSGSGFFNFYRNSSVIGSINQVGTTGISYNTSSDYRLKEDLQDFGGLDMVSKIPVYNYKWKSDESRSYGVMAHELQEVLPNAVTGEKDAEEMQGVDYSKIVPLLIKSIQELTAKVERLEAK